MLPSLDVNGQSYDLDGWALFARPGAPPRLELALGLEVMIYALEWSGGPWTLILRDCAAAYVEPEVLDRAARVEARLALPVPTPGPPLWRGGLPVDLHRAGLTVTEGQTRLLLDLGAPPPPLELTDQGWRVGGRPAEVEAGFRVLAGRGTPQWRREP
ncbi:MAG: hypothetical protein R3F62_08830 [Planctomycetota bacterium]